MITLLERLPRIGSLGGSLAFALACSCLAFLARLALDAGAPASLSVLIVYPVIVLAGAVGGRSASLGVLALESLSHAWLNLATGTGAEEAENLVLFVLSGAVVALAAGEMRQVLDRAEQLQGQVTCLQRYGNMGCWDWAPDGSTLRLSAEAWALLGQPPQDRSLSVGQLHTLLHPDDVAAFRAATRTVLAGQGHQLTAEFRVVMPQGRTEWRLMRGGAAADGKGIGGILADIDAQKRAASAGQAAIARQHLLYGELTHRVRNNFQLVASHLRLQSRRVDPALRPLLDAAIERVQGMAALHNTLYREEMIGQVPLDEYLRQICESLVQTLIGERPITLAVEVEPVVVPAERGLLLGLAVTELVVNAAIHGFAPDQAGRITVAFERVGEGFRLRVEDDGRGFDELALMRMEGYGMTLVRSCARQLEGELITQRHPHTRFEIRLPAQFGAPPGPV